MARYLIIVISIFINSVASAQSVVQEWAALYNSPGFNQIDSGRIVSVDDNGNVYTAGLRLGSFSDILLVKYDSQGNQLWQKTLSSPGFFSDDLGGMVVKNTGEIYLALNLGSANPGTYDILLCKFSPGGNLVWRRMLESVPGAWDIARTLKLDNQGNIYVAGYGDSSFNTSMSIFKLDRNGHLAWNVLYNDSVSGLDQAIDLAIDSVGNVYVVGTLNYNTSDSDIITLKYDPNGNLLWLNSYTGSQINSTDFPIGVRLDKNGNIVVAGTAKNNSTENDYLVLKYSIDGTLLWSDAYHIGSFDIPVGFWVDRAANIILTGNSGTIKYDKNNNFLWLKTSADLVNSGWQPKAIITDSAANIYLTGYQFIGSTTIKTDPDGNTLWSIDYISSSTGVVDPPRSIVLDKNNNVYIAGDSYEGGLNDVDMLTVKYNQL